MSDDTDTILTPTIVDHRLFVVHNMPCAVCRDEKAVYSCNTGVFHPCWTCQWRGYRLIRRWRWPWQRRKEAKR